MDRIRADDLGAESFFRCVVREKAMNPFDIELFFAVLGMNFFSGFEAPP